MARTACRSQLTSGSRGMFNVNNGHCFGLIVIVAPFIKIMQYFTHTWINCPLLEILKGYLRQEIHVNMLYC